MGEEIAKELSVQEWAVSAAGELVDAARGQQQFEMFEECEKYIQEQMVKDQNLKRSISKGAYDHGVGEEAVQRVYAVVLRDALMELLGPAS